MPLASGVEGEVEGDFITGVDWVFDAPVRAWAIMAVKSDKVGSAVDVLFAAVPAEELGSSELVEMSLERAGDSLASDATKAETDKVGG